MFEVQIPIQPQKAKVNTVNYHIKKIFADAELDEGRSFEKFE